MRRAAATIGLAMIALAARATAQDASVVDPELEAFRRMIDANPFESDEHDPIGASSSDRALHEMPLPEPEEIVTERIAPQRGEIVTAIPGVRATEHRAEVELREGLAIVRERVSLASAARVAAEARLRLAVPHGAALAALEVCDARGCRAGIAEGSRGALGAYDDAVRASGDDARPPIAHARVQRDERGEAIVVRVAPVRREPLEVRVTWALRTPVRGGRVRFVVPPRGNDARAAETRWSVRAIDVVTPALDGVPLEGAEETRSPAVPVAIDAALPITAALRATASFVRCGAGRCARLRAVAGRPRIASGDVIIAIDASPSTVASARGRIAPAARALLAILPASARVRVVAFAARAEEVSAGWSAPSGLDAAAITGAVERELGSATRLEALWSAIEPWARGGTRLVIVGDGGLTESDAGAAALAAAAQRGVAIASVNVADRASTRALRGALETIGGAVIDAGEEAERAAAGRSHDELVARLSAAIAPRAARSVVVRIGEARVDLGALAEGEERSWEGPVGRDAAIAIDAAATRASAASAELEAALRALVATEPIALAAIEASDAARSDAGSCRARGPYASSSGVVRRGDVIALAETRRCDAPAAASVAAPRRSGLPARALLQTLRRRVIPPARACFRADRAGRAAYQERAELRIELADREIVAARVEGAIEEGLRECLSSALDGIEVPGFDGRVIATWSLYTAPTLPPPVLELAPEVAHEVDRVAAPSDDLDSAAPR